MVEPIPIRCVLLGFSNVQRLVCRSVVKKYSSVLQAVQIDGDIRLFDRQESSIDGETRCLINIIINISHSTDDRQ